MLRCTAIREMTFNRCIIPGCDRKVHGHGWCRLHYQRWHKWGDPMTALVARDGASVEHRFWLKVDKTAPDGCWVWTAHIHRLGYGLFNSGGRTRLAHRVSYELSGFELTDGLELDHLCRNRACVNPAHLEQVSHVVNVRRGRTALMESTVAPEVRAESEVGEHE